MVKLEWVFLLQIVMGILLLMLLLRMNQIKKQVDGIIMEVQGYVDFITKDENIEGSIVDIEKGAREESVAKRDAIKQKKEMEISQNHLIQTVLEEYFL